MTSQAPAGTGRDCFTRALLGGTALRPLPFPKRAWGSGIKPLPHNCLTFYQINRFGSELVTEADAGSTLLALLLGNAFWVRRSSCLA